MANRNSYTIGVIILTLVTVFLLAFAFPPFNFFPVSFIAFIPFIIIIYKADKFKYFIISASLFVVLFFGYLLIWVAAFMLRETAAIVSFLTLFTILFLMIFLFYLPAMLISSFISKKLPSIRFLAVAVVFTSMEFMRTIGYLGFPWGIAGYSQWNFLSFIQISDIVGVLGISFLVYFINAVIAHYILVYAERPELKRPYMPALICILVFGIVILYGFIKLNIEDSKRSIRPKTQIALVQKAFDPNINWRSIYTGEPAIRGSRGIQGLAERFLLKPQKFKDMEQPDGITQNGTVAVTRVANLAREAALSKPSLTVYSESVTLDAYGFYTSEYKNQYINDNTVNNIHPGIYNTYILYKMITATKGYHLVGTTIIKENTNENAYDNYEYYNGIEFVGPDGNVIDEYSKIVLVPGGEAYPFQDNEFLQNTPPFKSIIKFMYDQFDKAGANRWSRGKRITVFDHPNGYKFAAIICFESAFGDFVRKFAYDGAQTLAIVTEDAWSYSDNSQWQHFYMAVFRAIENRKDVVQNGNSGVTGHISSSGRIINTLPFWKPDYMLANVALSDEMTIYTRYGEWFIVLCFVTILVLIGFSISKSFSDRKKSAKYKDKEAKKKIDYISNKNSNRYSYSNYVSNNSAVQYVNYFEKEVKESEGILDIHNVKEDLVLPTLDEIESNVKEKSLDKTLEQSSYEEDTDGRFDTMENTQYMNNDIVENIVEDSLDSLDVNNRENNNDFVIDKAKAEKKGTEKSDIFSDDLVADYGNEIYDILDEMEEIDSIGEERNNKEKKLYSIFDDDNYSSKSSLSDIIEESIESKFKKKS